MVPPRSGRNHVLRLGHELTRPGRRPRRPGATTDLAGLLHAALATIRRRSLVFLVSDFITVPGGSGRSPVSPHRHEVVAVRLVDPLERELPEVGLIVVEDAETGEQVVADTSDPEFRRRFHAEVDAREQALQEAVRRAGVRLHDIATDDDLVAALVEMVRRSKQPRDDVRLAVAARRPGAGAGARRRLRRAAAAARARRRRARRVRVWW